MPFFDDDDEAADVAPEASPQAYPADPWRPPDNWLPASIPWHVGIARTLDTAVAVYGVHAYPQGLAFTLVIRMRPGTEEPPLEWRMRSRGRTAGSTGGLTFALTFADGRQVVQDTSQIHTEAPLDGLPRLSTTGGGGVQLGFYEDLWLWPLPAVGAVTVTASWEERGVAVSQAIIDVSDAVRAAVHAVPLWPMTPE